MMNANTFIAEQTLFFNVYQQLNKLALENSIVQELFDDLIKKSVEYAQFRLSWSLATTNDKLSMDARRTEKHNQVLISIDVLERFLNHEKLDVSWRKNIGYKHTGEERKCQGDFACYLGYIETFKAR